MATIYFYLDKPDCKGQSPIFLVYQHKGKKFKYFTKEKVPAKSWDKQKVKKNYAFEGDVNGNLETLSEAIKKIERDARFLNLTITVEYVYQKFLEHLKGEKSGDNFYEIVNTYLQISATTKTAKTIKNKKTTLLTTLKEFEDKKKLYYQL